MLNPSKRKEIIASEKRMLAEKIKVVEDRIKFFEIKKKSIQHDIPNDNCRTIAEDAYTMKGRTGDEGEDLAKMKKCVQGSLELLDVQFLNYNQVMLPPQQGLPGIWKETTIDMMINNFLKTSIIKVTVNEEDDPDNIISLRCIIKGRPHRYELAGLAEVMCEAKDIAGLTHGLRQYGRLATVRKAAFVQLKETYGDFFQSQVTESGIVLEWRDNLFRVRWSIQWDENIEAITDTLDIDVNPSELGFINACHFILEELTDKTTTASVRGACLMELAGVAASC